MRGLAIASRVLCGVVCLAAASPVQAAGKCPNLTILLDASGSMLENPAGPQSVQEPDVSKRKYSVAVAALTDLVNLYDGVLPIGLSIFPSDGMCGAAKLDVPPALYTRQQIISLLNSSAPQNFAPDTPTSASIGSLAAKSELKDASRGQYILLLTDGKPECSNGSEDVPKTITALSNADMATPIIKTFVVGFGALNSTAQTAMNQMADAGGAPSGDPTYHYYRAESSATLVAALDKILTSISGDAGGGMCDDTCYGMGCANATDKCISGMCKPDPCSGVACTAPQFCYTDGVSAGVCVDTCAAACPSGTYCDRGQCISTPCGVPCGPGKQCNETTKQCEDDPSCANLKPKCLAPRGCIAGKCVDDPCNSNLIKCPAGAMCVPWAGTCQQIDPVMNPDGDDGGLKTGCSCQLFGRETPGAPWAAFAGLMLGVLFLRRSRRENRAQVAESRAS